MSDVFDLAADAKVAPKVYFGQIFVDWQKVRFAKGFPKELFDPTQHPEEHAAAQAKIDVQMTTANGSTYEKSREIVCNTQEWAGIVLPSLKVAGWGSKEKLRELHEKWCSFEWISTGRTYTNAYGTFESKTFKFLAIYPDEAACRAAEAAHYSRGGDDDQDAEEPLPMPESDPPGENSNSDADKSAERANLAKFLPLLWTQAGGDVVKFGALLQANPLLAVEFDLNSAEVQAVIGQ